ncbi:MAG: ADP-glyceromanno-heptose 6-epimerase [Bacteroidota bacterium]
MIIVTGAAGFIGSCMAHHLIAEGQSPVVCVDDFSREDKAANLPMDTNCLRVDRQNLFDWWEEHRGKISWVIHLGARTDTAELSETIFNQLNLHYSQQIWTLCARDQLPLIYASSAATYGGGEHGFSDAHEGLAALQPLNPYGWSKHRMDLWALQQATPPPFWAGLKFFNVFGPNEFHKGRMASVIFHAYHQITRSGGLKLFRSHRADYQDGMQMRDFIYVKDLVAVMRFLMEGKTASGLYNLGTGQARTFLDLGRAVFSALEVPANIAFVDTPIDIRDTYQYFTEAQMVKLRTAGWGASFTPLEAAIDDYVKKYLVPGKYFQA